MKRTRFRPALPAPESSARLLLKIAPAHMAMFRFLLEAYDNLAIFSVLDKHVALLKLSYSPHQEREVRAALEAIATDVPLSFYPWPVACGDKSREAI